MKFERYGNLEYLDAKKFYEGGWGIYDTDRGEDGEDYDIVISTDKTELKYSTV